MGLLKFHIWKPSITVQKRENTEIWLAVGFHGVTVERHGEKIYPRPLLVMVKRFYNRETGLREGDPVVEVCQLDYLNLVRLVAGFFALVQKEEELVKGGYADAKIFPWMLNDAKEFNRDIVKEMAIQLSRYRYIDSFLIKNVTIQELKEGILERSFTP